MSLTALAWAFRMATKGAQKAALLAIADHADGTGRCFPSISRLALWAGLTERGVRSALRELETAGLLLTTHERGHRSQYQLVMSASGKQRRTPEPRSAPTPEPRSAPAPTASPEAGSGGGGSTCRGTPEPRSAKPLREPSLNRQKRESAQSAADLLSGEEVLPPPRARATRRKPETAIDPAWFPDPAGIEYAKGYGIVDVGFEVEKFRNWHLARDVRRRDWAHAWRNWSQNHKEFHQPRGNGAAGDHTTSTRPAADGGGLVGAAARMWRGRPGGDGDG